MDVLPLNFRALWLCGIWYEKKRSFDFLRQIYQLLVIIIVFYYTFTLTAEIALKNGDIDDLTAALFLAMTYLTLCIKILNFVYRRQLMWDILTDLRMPCCKATDAEEAKILAKHSKIAKWLFVSLMTFVSFDVASFYYTFTANAYKGNLHLPFKTYQFYNISDPRVLYSTAGFQSVAVLYSVVINISFDTMSASLFMIMTGQLELNAHRLSKLNRGDVAGTTKCVAHNVLIRGVVKKVESFIIGVVIPFFLLSLTSVCTSVFQVSKYNIFSLDFVGLCMFATCILTQVLIYCWFGNELLLKSEAISNAVYKSDWIAMSPGERKTLCILMICNKKGRSVSYGGTCTLNLDTFVWIVKTAYATISLLHQIKT